MSGPSQRHTMREMPPVEAGRPSGGGGVETAPAEAEPVMGVTLGATVRVQTRWTRFTMLCLFVSPQRKPGES